ncbi:MAG TPA: cysteine-rich CWC family protein [Bacillota bacterium]
MTVEKKQTHCPICGGDNNCCYSMYKRRGICWCTKESFPDGIFSLVPIEKRRKSCICKDCLQSYKETHRL